MKRSHAITWAGGFLLGGVAVAMRVHNAAAYPILQGFDAKGNWLYILKLTKVWALPDPGESWSASDPPLFFYAAAALTRAFGWLDAAHAVTPLRVAVAAFGVVTALLCTRMVQRLDPDRPLRAVLAGALLLFLPVHVMTSTMINEDVVAAFFASATVIGLVAAATRPRGFGFELFRAAGIGALAGLTLLTKVSGAIVVAVVVAATAWDGWRKRAPGAAASRIAVSLTASLLVGGWFYAYTYVQSGHIYRTSEPADRLMAKMPPGERGLLDYVRVPASTWTDPQMLDPDLLRSVWGGTYASVWFDAHRHFLPREGESVRRAGGAILLLALLPTLAFLVGLVAGARRCVRDANAADPPLLLLVAATVAGYALFTWRVPAYVAVKGNYLLGLSVPFAFYASDRLERWIRAGGTRGAIVAGLLVLLAIAIAATFTYGFIFTKIAPAGLPWWNHPL